MLGRCLGNVVGKTDRRGNLNPTEYRSDQKTGAAVALMMAIGRAMVVDEEARGRESFLTHPIVCCPDPEIYATIELTMRSTQC